MKYILIISALIIIGVLSVYLYVSQKDNKKIQRQNELMRTQLSMINRLISTESQTLEVDDAFLKDADLLVDQGDDVIVIYKSEMQGVPDFSVVVGPNGHVKYIGEYKP